MIINDIVCCGPGVEDPNKTPTFVTLTGPIFVQAHFDETNANKKSSPTCSETFTWAGDSTEVRFTDDFTLMSMIPGLTVRELCYINLRFSLTFESVITQKKARGSSFNGNACPVKKNQAPVKNPYYFPITSNFLNGAEEPENPPIALGASFGFSDPATVDSPNADKFLTNPNSNFGNAPASYLPPPLPVKLASTFDTTFNPVGLDGGAYTGDSYGATLFGQQDNSNFITKRGTPVEFRAWTVSFAFQYLMSS